jgi:parallel beta-helix repeat protein
MQYRWQVAALCASLLFVACQSLSEEQVAEQRQAQGLLSLPSKTTLRVEADRGFNAGEYVRPAVGPRGERGVILIEGREKLTLDLTGVDLRGTQSGTPLDRNQGFGVVVRGSSDIVIRGGTLGGYKTCIVIENSSNVTIEDMNFKSWYGQRLKSTKLVENEADWLRPHDNESGEWMAKYGAAISVTDSEDVTIRNCRGRKGQNGILLTRSTNASVYDNDFSFLSGWGVALFRASRNTISHNIFDYNVRGYSHDVYWRGQDSAGMLFFERSCDNIVAYNSATHSGDGVFLFGGRDIVDGVAIAHGELTAGGSDRNLFFENDLRYAVANSLEATFSSRNRVIDNELSGSRQHGIWGGYSNSMIIHGNKIEAVHGPAISIEHGQACLISKNHLKKNRIGIELYWDEDPQFVKGPFGDHRDTASRDHWVLYNRFASNDQDLVFKQTQGITLASNSFDGTSPNSYVHELSDHDGQVSKDEEVRSWLQGVGGARPSAHVSATSLRRFTGETPEAYARADKFEAPAVAGVQETRDPKIGGLETIVMGEWGPWDFRSGEERPHVGPSAGLLTDLQWDATWFRWDAEASDPRGDLDAWRALRFEPLMRKTVSSWSAPFPDAQVETAVGATHFGMIARATIVVADDGSYSLSVTSDDGVRVRVDGETVLEDWTWHAPRQADASFDLPAGEHELELEYFQIDGALALTLELQRND